MKITVSYAVSQADLPTPDMNRVKVTSTTTTHSDTLRVLSSVFKIAQRDTRNKEYLIS